MYDKRNGNEGEMKSKTYKNRKVQATSVRVVFFLPDFQFVSYSGLTRQITAAAATLSTSTPTAVDTLMGCLSTRENRVESTFGTAGSSVDSGG
jgi:hypothetical protein